LATDTNVVATCHYCLATDANLLATDTNVLATRHYPLATDTN